jgi:hypothetical protein
MADVMMWRKLSSPQIKWKDEQQQNNNDCTTTFDLLYQKEKKKQYLNGI